MFVVRIGEVKLTFTQAVIIHMHTLRLQRNKRFATLSCQLLRFEITDCLSDLRMVHTEMRGKRKEKKKQAEVISRKRLKMLVCIEHLPRPGFHLHPSYNFHETLQVGISSSIA